MSGTPENDCLLKRTHCILIFLYLFEVLSLILNGCFYLRKGDELTKFTSFQYSYQNSFKSKYFAVMFTQSDTIFLKKYSGTNHDTLFYSLLPFSGRDTINWFVKKMDLSILDSINDLKNSQERIVFDLDFPNETHSVYLQSLHPPVAYVKFNKWIRSLADCLNFTPIDTFIKFKEDANIHHAIQKNNR